MKTAGAAWVGYQVGGEGPGPVSDSAWRQNIRSVLESYLAVSRPPGGQGHLTVLPLEPRRVELPQVRPRSAHGAGLHVPAQVVQLEGEGGPAL